MSFHFFPFYCLIFLISFLPKQANLCAQEFSEVAEEAGIDFLYYSEFYITGTAVIDYNNDGYEDLYTPGGRTKDALYQNNGDGTFTNVIDQIDAFDIVEDVITMGVVAGDINNDGFRDLFVSTILALDNFDEWTPNFLFLNNGDGTFTDISVSSNVGVDPFYSGAATFGDVNNDGFLDLYVCNYIHEGIGILDTSMVPQTGDPNHLFLNNGDNTFTNVYAEYGVGDVGTTLGVAFLDINNDANIDIFSANDKAGLPFFTYPNSLFLNNYPQPNFSDISISSGIDEISTSMGLAIGDYDENGYLDVYVTYCGRNTLWQNNGDETFTDVSDIVGVGDDDVPIDTDINDFQTLLYRITPEENFLGIDTSTFEICLEGETDTVCYNFSMLINVIDSIWRPEQFYFIEINNGYNFYPLEEFTFGIGDLATTGIPMNTSSLICMEIPDTMQFYFNLDSRHSIEEVEINENILPSTGWGANFLDYDHDIDLDLFVANGNESAIGPRGDNANTFFKNNGDGTFSNTTEEAGVDNPWSARGSVIFDYDNDGDEDLFVMNLTYGIGFGEMQDPKCLLYRNNLEHTVFNNWLKVQLEGNESNRDGIGAMVRVHAGFKTLIRQIDGGSSGMSHNSIIAHFGLGAYDMVDSMEIVWPGGCTQMLYDIDVDQQINVIQDCGGLPTAISLPAIKNLSLQAFPNPANEFSILSFELDEEKDISIGLYDSKGQLVKKVFNGLTSDGLNSFTLNVSNLSSGIYSVRIKLNGQIYTRQIVVAD